MSGGHQAAGIRPDRPALAVSGPKIGGRELPAVDDDAGANLDTLARNGGDSLDERRHATRAEPVSQISAVACFLEEGRNRRADKHQIAGGNGSVKRVVGLGRGSSR